MVNEPGIAVSQTRTDNLNSFEDHGASVQLTGEKVLGTVVVCISPSSTGKKLPGEWRQQNGYTGDKCTTAWFNGGGDSGRHQPEPGPCQRDHRADHLSLSSE